MFAVSLRPHESVQVTTSVAPILHPTTLAPVVGTAVIVVVVASNGLTTPNCTFSKTVVPVRVHVVDPIALVT